MTQIDFYFHVEDKLRTACTLSAKAYARGLRVLAYCADHEAGQKFSRLLWAAPPIGFVPTPTTKIKKRRNGGRTQPARRPKLSRIVGQQSKKKRFY